MAGHKWYSSHYSCFHRFLWLHIQHVVMLQNSNRPVTRVTTPSDTLGRCTDTDATLSFIYSQVPEGTSPPNIDEHIYATFTTLWPYVSLSVLTTILVIACIANLWQRFQKSHRTSLNLEITTGRTCELFTLLTLPLCPHNWNIQTPYRCLLHTYNYFTSYHLSSSYSVQ